MHALVGAVALGRELEEALEYAEDHGWSAADPLFIDTVVYANGHMATSEFAIKLAGRLGTYLLAGDLMPEDAIDKLQVELREAKANHGFGFRADALRTADDVGRCGPT